MSTLVYTGKTEVQVVVKTTSAGPATPLKVMVSVRHGFPSNEVSGHDLDSHTLRFDSSAPPTVATTVHPWVGSGFPFGWARPE